MNNEAEKILFNELDKMNDLEETLSAIFRMDRTLLLDILDNERSVSSSEIRGIENIQTVILEDLANIKNQITQAYKRIHNDTA